MTYTTYKSYKTYQPPNSTASEKKSWGGYKNLASFQNTVIIYDFTLEFVKKYIDYKSRTKDQMEQAARSGKQNIAEGSMASQTSKKTEIKLMGVARASLTELQEDYTDFLRQKNLALWDKNSPPAQEIRKLAYKSYKSYMTYKSYLDYPEAAANCLICLISQTTYLLDRQITSLENNFLEKGGFTENLYLNRLKKRNQ